ncbi:uncharacterized protein LOC134213251 [Armigeres subalbatus]|uniref:uncharacterized protein LOC134213251 n=1 Tax=Armigeres subalbatus TaxID=124917 RepID=UPI002ED0083A
MQVQDENQDEFSYTDYEELINPDTVEEGEADNVEEADPLQEVSGAASDDVFSFTGIFFQRFYKSQLRPKEGTRMVVHGDTATEIIDCMWDIALAKIERQVLFDDETPRCLDNAHPTVNDVNDFNTLQDTTKKRFTQQLMPLLPEF